MVVSIGRRDLLLGSAAAAAMGGGLLVARPARAAAGRQVLQAKPAPLDLGGEFPAPTPGWAYGGRVPGPVVRARQGDWVDVMLQNDLPQSTTVHWHGVRIDNAMDGVPGLTQQAVKPGETFAYRFLAPDAGTFWYHSHQRSWEQMARGLHGLLVVEEREPPAVDSDLLFAADDWLLQKDGALAEASFGDLHDWAHAGRLGNWLTINGTSHPKLEIPAGGRVRLRCANVANARTLAFDVAALEARVVALDGQPLAAPAKAEERMELAPGQRTDLIFDVPDQAGATIPIHEISTRDRIKATTMTIVPHAVPVGRPPLEAVVLPANPLSGDLELNQALNLDLVMEGGAMGGLTEAVYQGKKQGIRELAAQKRVWAFNGVSDLPEAPFVDLPRGRIVTLHMINQTAWPHAIHVHGHHFRVIERDGVRVDEPAWRDTELVRRGERTRIAFAADNPGSWLIHCHMLEHQAAGMRTWFRVSA